MLTVVVLVLASTQTARFVEQVVSMAVGDDCCDDGCEDGDARECEGACGHCVCSASASVLPTSPQVTPTVQAVAELPLIERNERPCATGYHTPPFRPPAA
jgi:hypothetical protein